MSAEMSAASFESSLAIIGWRRMRFIFTFGDLLPMGAAQEGVVYRKQIVVEL